MVTWHIGTRWPGNAPTSPPHGALYANGGSQVAIRTCVVRHHRGLFYRGPFALGVNEKVNVKMTSIGIDGR